MSPSPEGRRSRRRSGRRHGWYVDTELDPTQGAGCCAPPYKRVLICDLVIFGGQALVCLAYVVMVFTLPIEDSEGRYGVSVASAFFSILLVITILLTVFVTSAIYHCSSEPTLMNLWVMHLGDGCSTMIAFLHFGLTIANVVLPHGPAYGPLYKSIPYFVVLLLLFVLLIVTLGWIHLKHWDINEAHGKRFGKKLDPAPFRRGRYSSASLS